MSKKEQIKLHVIDLINASHEAMLNKIDKAIDSDALDIDSWDNKINPMVIPKIITTAILKNESHQYEGKGTSFEKMIKRETKNLEYFL